MIGKKFLSLQNAKTHVFSIADNVIGGTMMRPCGLHGRFVFESVSLLHIHDLVLLWTLRSLKRKDVSPLFFHQGSAERREVRYFMLLHISLGGSYDLVGMLLFFTLLLNSHK